MISRRDEENSSPGPYSILIGALLCVAQCTRADISFAVNWLLQFLRDPWESHCFATLRVLNYLITTKKIQLQLGGGTWNYLGTWIRTGRRTEKLDDWCRHTSIVSDWVQSLWSLGNKQLSPFPVPKPSIRHSRILVRRPCGSRTWWLNSVSNLTMLSRCMLTMRVVKCWQRIRPIVQEQNTSMHFITSSGNVWLRMRLIYSTCQPRICWRTCWRNHFWGWCCNIIERCLGLSDFFSLFLFTIPSSIFHKR